MEEYCNKYDCNTNQVEERFPLSTECNMDCKKCPYKM